MDNTTGLNNAPRSAGFRPESGLTLIELMVVVVIVGILAAVAYPSFRQQALKSARADAKSALVDGVSRQEEFFLDNRTYASSLASLNMNTTTENGYYTVSIDGATVACPITRCFSMRATPAGRQADDTKCAALIINSSGGKSATGPTAGDCW
jgi:type IV pilus assembly protein PilE